MELTKPPARSAEAEAPESVPASHVRWVPVGLAGMLFLVYATFSLVRHWRVESTGYDLGILGQAVRAYSEFRAPIGSLMKPNYNLLGDHFSPIVALLAPFYRLWPDVRVILLAQAFLVAVSVVPVGRLAVRRLGTRAGVAVTAAYGISWGVQGMIAYDAHEVSFAIPLMALAMCALAEERWRAAILWTLPLLLVKEDLGLTVAAVGGYLCLRRQWKAGIAVIATGGAAMAVIMFVIIPSINPLGEHAQWGRVSGHHTFLETLIDMPVNLVQPASKLLLVVMVLGGVAGVALRSPLLLIAVPTVLWRLASAYPLHWSVLHVHYNAILMPIVFVALIDAIPRLRESSYGWLRAYARLAVPGTLVFAVAMLPLYPFRSMMAPSFYHETPRAEGVRNIIRQIPDDARVAASNYLAPQLTARTHVILFPKFTDQDPVDWVVVDTSRMSGVPAPRDKQEAALRALPAQGFRLVAERHGIMLYRRA